MSPYTQAVFVPRSSAHNFSAGRVSSRPPLPAARHRPTSQPLCCLPGDRPADRRPLRRLPGLPLQAELPANIAEPTSAIPADNGDLVLPEFNGGIAAEAAPAKTLTANCSAATWYAAFQVMKIDCIPYAKFKDATGDTVQVYKDTLRLLFQKHTPNSSRAVSYTHLTLPTIPLV